MGDFCSFQPSIFQGVDTKKGGLQTLPFLNQQKGEKITLSIGDGRIYVPGQVWPWKLAGGNFRTWRLGDFMNSGALI